MLAAAGWYGGCRTHGPAPRTSERGLDHSNGQVLMSIRRSSALALLFLSLLSAACGESDAAKSSPRDAVGMGEAEGAAAGTSTSAEDVESLSPGQTGTAANDTVPHRPAEAMPQQP